MLKKDHFIFGSLIGIFFPVIVLGGIYGINYLLIILGVAEFYMDLQTAVLVSLGANMVAIRYYFVNLKYDKTGRGVLFFTFVMILLFFIFKDNWLT
jgi:hypothetical protein